jgi:hypothetical protein
VRDLVERPGAARQLRVARDPKRLPGLVEAMARAFRS